MGGRQGADPHHGGDGGQVHLLDKGAQRLFGPGGKHAAARAENRPLAGGERLGGLADLEGMPLGAGLIADDIHRAAVIELPIIFCCISMGTSMSTGPGRPVEAMWNASLNTREGRRPF